MLLHPCVLPRVPAGVVPAGEVAAGSVPAVESADVGNLNSTKGKTERREGGFTVGVTRHGTYASSRRQSAVSLVKREKLVTHG